MDSLVSQTVSGMEAFFTEYQGSPFDWLYESDVQGTLFERLRSTLVNRRVTIKGGMDRVGHYLGHSSQKTTQRYAKLAGERLTDVPRGENGPHVVPTPKTES